MVLRRYLVVAALLLASAGCRSSSNASSSSGPSSGVDSGSASRLPTGSGASSAAPSATSAPRVAEELEPARGAPRASTAALRAFATASNTFGLQLYRALSSAKEPNLAISPISVTLALTMTWAGARTETAAEMGRVLHLSGDQAESLVAAGDFLESLSTRSPLTTVAVANRLFVQEGYPLAREYERTIRDDFGAPVQPMAFASAPEKARLEINRWVAQTTDQRIPELLAPQSIGSSTRLVLTNAIYFLGKWLAPFERTETRPRRFTIGPTRVEEVLMMRSKGTFAHAKVPGAQVLELRYAAKEPSMSMVIVLPDENEGLGRLEQTITYERLSRWLTQLRRVTVDVQLPRFEAGTHAELGLALQSLGMRRAFGRGADFRAMSEGSDLMIDEVHHGTFVKVDEEGTEAAAATAVVMRAAATRPDQNVEFTVDHPFLFLVRELRSGALLFLGRVTDPSA